MAKRSSFILGRQGTAITIPLLPVRASKQGITATRQLISCLLAIGLARTFGQDRVVQQQVVLKTEEGSIDERRLLQ